LVKKYVAHNVSMPNVIHMDAYRIHDLTTVFSMCFNFNCSSVF